MTPLPDVDLSFRDYVLAAAPASASDAARDYWTGRLDTLPPAPMLPLQNAVKPQPTRFTRRDTCLAAPAWQRVKERARRYNLTASMVLAAAYAEVLSAWSEGQDVTLNFTLFDRRDVHPHIQRVVG